VYAVTNSVAKIHVVNLANGKLILTPYQVKTNRYLGKTQGYTIATSVIRVGQYSSAAIMKEYLPV